MLAVGLGGLGVVLELFALALTWSVWREKMFQALETTARILDPLRILNLVFFLAAIVAYIYLTLGPLGEHFQFVFTRLFLYWLVVLAGCLLLKSWSLGQVSAYQRRWLEFLGIATLLATFGVQISAFLPEISTYPFTLSWSETSRYYYASLFFSERIYGIPIPPTVLHPSRYLMQAVPFLIPGTPLWLHRTWQVFLWLATTLTSASLLVWRLSLSGRMRRWLLIAWISSFILLGPVYYHLQIPVILVLWGFHRRESAGKSELIKAALAVVAASAWVGISRLNWFPVPGLLAAMLYLLERPLGYITSASSALLSHHQEQPHPARRPLWRYLIEPAAWFLIGTGVAFAAQALYILWSGNESEQFATSFTSDLLWYRLFPSSTYPLGILPAALLVSLPLFLLVASRLIEAFDGVPAWRYFHPVRLLGLAAILAVLLAGGLVVSTKIGGGSNLHNLDAYLMLLLVASAFIIFRKMVPDYPLALALTGRVEGDVPASLETASGQPMATHQKVLRLGIVLALVIPAYLSVVARGATEPLPDQAKISRGLEVVAEQARQASQQGGEVLFLTDRHLLTFDYLHDVPLVPEYERVFLMEMAMAGNPEYLGKFHADLKNHRFALIVSEPLFKQKKGRTQPFGEENDAWVKQVSEYILCYYKPVHELPAIRIQFMVPDPRQKDCP
jgi:hypothetical protein